MKTLNDYKDEDGGYVDEAGCHWQDAENFLQGGLLGFCCCGDPGDNARYVHGALKLLHERSAGNRPSALPEAWKAATERFEAYFSCARSREFMLYWLDSKGFTEHGSSLYDCWLTKKGDQALALLQEFVDAEDAEDRDNE